MSKKQIEEVIIIPEPVRDAWTQGYLTSANGRGKLRNPFPLGTKDWEDFICGWECQYYGEGRVPPT